MKYVENYKRICTKKKRKSEIMILCGMKLTHCVVCHRKISLTGDESVGGCVNGVWWNCFSLSLPLWDFLFLFFVGLLSSSDTSSYKLKDSSNNLWLHSRSNPAKAYFMDTFFSRSNMIRVFKGLSSSYARYMKLFSYWTEKADDKASAIKGNNEESFFAWPPLNGVFMDSCIIKLIDFLYPHNSFLLSLSIVIFSFLSNDPKSFSGKILVTDCCCWMFHWPFAWLSPSFFFSLFYFPVLTFLLSTDLCVSLCTHQAFFIPFLFSISSSLI